MLSPLAIYPENRPLTVAAPCEDVRHYPSRDRKGAVTEP